MLTASASGLYFFAAQSPTPPIPLFTLRRALAMPNAKLGAKVDRYSFFVRPLPPLLHTGLARRTNIATSLIDRALGADPALSDGWQPDEGDPFTREARFRIAV